MGPGMVGSLAYWLAQFPGEFGQTGIDFGLHHPLWISGSVLRARRKAAEVILERLTRIHQRPGSQPVDRHTDLLCSDWLRSRLERDKTNRREMAQ